MSRCDHKFVDSRECVKCGVSVEQLTVDQLGQAYAGELGGRANATQFIPNEVRAERSGASHYSPPSLRVPSDEALASRFPQLDAVWYPVVKVAARWPELASVTYGANWLQLHYQLGPLSSSCMLAIEQVTQVRASEPPIWKDRLAQTLLRLRLARAQLDVDVSSVEERDARARRRRADELEEIEGHGDQ